MSNREGMEVPPWVPSWKIGPALQRDIDRILKRAGLLDVPNEQ